MGMSNTNITWARLVITSFDLPTIINLNIPSKWLEGILIIENLFPGLSQVSVAGTAYGWWSVVRCPTATRRGRRDAFGPYWVRGAVDPLHLHPIPFFFFLCSTTVLNGIGGIL